jgi:hypothetical protein
LNLFDKQVWKKKPSQSQCFYLLDGMRMCQHKNILSPKQGSQLSSPIINRMIEK